MTSKLIPEENEKRITFYLEDKKIVIFFSTIYLRKLGIN